MIHDSIQSGENMENTKGLKILIIEDVAVHLHLMSHILIGYNSTIIIKTASSIKEALNFLKKKGV